MHPHTQGVSNDPFTAQETSTYAMRTLYTASSFMCTLPVPSSVLPDENLGKEVAKEKDSKL